MLRSAALVALALALSACATGGRGENDPPPEMMLSNFSAYPEGPIWIDGRLYVAEMGADRVSVFEGSNRRTFFQRSGCGPTAMAPYGSGYLVLCHLAGEIVAIDAGGNVRFARDRDVDGNEFRDPNDAYADGRGGVYFSDPGLFSIQTQPHGALVHIDSSGLIRRVATDLWYPNGVYVDQTNRQLYLSETFRHRVLRYTLSADGAVGTPETFFDVAAQAPAQTRYPNPYPEAGPDGLEIGPNGVLYVAIYGEGRILRVSPDRRYLGALNTNVRYVTNIAFDDAGNAATTGAIENEEPPFPGEVVMVPRSSLPTP